MNQVTSGTSRATGLRVISYLILGILLLSSSSVVEGFTPFSRQAATRPSYSSSQQNAPLWSNPPTTNDGASAVNGDNKPMQPQKKSKFKRFYKFPKTAYGIYTGYAKRLWTETNVDARRKIANQRVKGSIRNMQHILSSNEYADFSDGCNEAKDSLMTACGDMLSSLPVDIPPVVDSKEVATTAAVESKEVATTADGTESEAAKTAKPRRSILFGALMGAVVACWVFSGNYLFTGLFTLMTILGQLEYYRMVMNTGVYPARRISVIGASSMFLTALFAPDLHQICLPMFGLWAMIWFLTMRRGVTSISEIATTFTGMFYLGYVPSFWVRTRLIGGAMEPTRLAPIAGPFIAFMKETFGARLPVPTGVIYLPITAGSIFIFWSWLCLAFSDVGAYFVGRKYGKTKLGQVAPAAGATSPNKSVEGVIGGCAVSAALGILGAWVQKWPYFALTGALHGTILGLLGLIGDLTASMLKRDAGLKDFGDLLPEHGGIMDRVDSFIWTAPYSWMVCAYVIPALRAFALR